MCKSLYEVRAKNKDRRLHTGRRALIQTGERNSLHCSGRHFNNLHISRHITGYYIFCFMPESSGRAAEPTGRGSFLQEAGWLINVTPANPLKPLHKRTVSSMQGCISAGEMCLVRGENVIRELFLLRLQEETMQILSFSPWPDFENSRLEAKIKM